MTGPATLTQVWTIIAGCTALLVAATWAYAWARSKELQAMDAGRRGAGPSPAGEARADP